MKNTLGTNIIGTVVAGSISLLFAKVGAKFLTDSLTQAVELIKK